MAPLDRCPPACGISSEATAPAAAVRDLGLAPEEPPHTGTSLKGKGRGSKGTSFKGKGKGSKAFECMALKFWPVANEILSI